MPGLLDALKDPEFRRQVLQGLTDAGNRGLAAGLGGPVDLAELVVNAGLGLAGQKPISNSVGGSEWIGQQMQRMGSVSDVRNPSAEFLASLLMPGASVKGAKVIGKAVDNAQKPGTVARAGERGAIVYHGTPHKFDKFDSSKIGTGEGAQAYGHGLYFAESPEVAKQYQDALSKQVSYAGRSIAETHPSDSAIETAKHAVASRVANGEDAVSAIKAEAKSWKEQADFYRQYSKEVPEAAIEADSFDEVANAVGSLDPSAYVKNPGSLYSVDLPDDQIAKMLDWDKPLAGQGEEIVNFAREVFKNEPRFDPNYARGMELMQELRRDPVKAAEALKSLGIPGVRFLDEGSRVKGAGTQNFVVFPGNEDMLKILERNGKTLK